MASVTARYEYRGPSAVCTKNHVYKKVLLASQWERSFESLGRYSCRFRYSHSVSIARIGWLPVTHQ